CHTLCRVLPSLATWGRANPERCPKFLEFKPNTSVYVCITGLVRWAGKYIAKDDYTTSGCDSRRGHSGAVKERNTKAANGSGTSMCPKVLIFCSSAKVKALTCDTNTIIHVNSVRSRSSINYYNSSLCYSSHSRLNKDLLDGGSCI